MKITCTNKKKPQYFANMSNACGSEGVENIRVEGTEEIYGEDIISYEDWLAEHMPDADPDDDATYEKYLDWLADSDKPVESATTENVDATGELLDSVSTVTRKFMEDLGFSRAESHEYSAIEIHQDSESGCCVVEVRAELGYDELMNLSEVLDPIVQKYDEDAYFEAEDAGILVAYLNPSIYNATTGVEAADEYWLNPPEEDEPTVLDSYEDEVELDFSGVINVDSDGSWDWVDYEVPDKLMSSDERIELASDADSILEDINELIIEKVPMRSGYYKVSGSALLVFLISGVESYERRNKEDKTYETEIYTDNAEVEFLPNESEAYDDFSIEKMNNPHN